MTVDIHSISDSQLKSQVEHLARSERKITAQVVEHIAEVERRRLHLSWGYSSLFDYLTKCLQYSESAAFRRIQAARALRQMPVLAKSLENGSLKLSQVAQVQTALKQEERETGQRVSIERKREVFAKIENKNGHETKKIIVQSFGSSLDNEKGGSLKVEPVSTVELNLKVPDELFEDLKRVKELYSHINPHADWVEVIKLMTQDVLKKRDPLKQGTHKAPKKSDSQKAAVDDARMTQRLAATAVRKGKVHEISHRKPIPAATKRFVFQRDHGQCQYQAPDGHICGSRFQAQIDHVKPVYVGGTSEPGNLRILCRQHNMFRYEMGR